MEVLYTSIIKHHPEAHIWTVRPETDNNGYIPGMAKERLKQVLECFKQGWDHCVVLGADCELYGRLTEIEDSLKDNDIILVPHIMSPSQNRQQMARLYVTGHANADIMVFKNTENTINALNWMISVTEGNEPEFGIFYEQTWLSALPFLFPKVYILRDVRYNFGYWSIESNQISELNTIKLVQFSGFEKSKPERMSKHYSGNDITDEILKLYQEYDKKI